jgi:hypothetical protein
MLWLTRIAKPSNKTLKNFSCFISKKDPGHRAEFQIHVDYREK